MKNYELNNYTTHVETKVKKSSIKGAGLGMFANQDIPKLTVIGFYPGTLKHKKDIKELNENLRYLKI